MKRKIVVLTGGVGGAKLVLGLCHAVPAGDVTAIVNTGDDFEHLGLSISPDIDTLLYTLSAKANAEQGWGRADESWNFMSALTSLGGPDWFRLGDGDLALHVLRTSYRAAGWPLSKITADFAAAWGVEARILPMSDDPVATMLDTDEGRLAFQEYFVARRCVPYVRAIHFEGAPSARPAPGVIEAIGDPETRAILIAPSNPMLSIDPMLSVPGLRRALEAAHAPVVAISPLVGGMSVKGPTSKLMAELSVSPDATSIAARYEGLIDGIIVDERDPPCELNIPHARLDILMQTLEDRIRVAEAALSLADTLQ